MDIFRSVTISIAVILLIFMGMIMYYEFKVSSSSSTFPPYKKNCPDYSYEYTLPDNKNVCMFNNSFTQNYKTLFDTFNKDKVNLCNTPSNSEMNPLQCSTGGETYSPCNKNKSINYKNIRNCHLTLDGII